MKVFKALFLGLTLVLFVLNPVFANSVRMAEIRTAMFDSYLATVELAEQAREASSAAAEARRTAALYAEMAANSVLAGRFAEAIEYVLIADENEALATNLEAERENLLDLADAELYNIAELAGEFATINSALAEQNEGIANEITATLDSLLEQPSEEAVETTDEVATVEEVAEDVEEPVAEEVVEAEEAPAVEEVAVVEPEKWLVGSLVITEDDMVMNFRDDLERYPFLVEVFEEEVVVSQAELGVRVDGTYVGPDEEGWVGFTPNTFVGIPDDYIDEFFYLVEEYNVELPEVYWFKGGLDGNQATLEAEGTIDGIDYHLVIGFLAQ